MDIDLRNDYFRNDFVFLSKKEYSELLRAKFAIDFLQKYLANNQYATLSDLKIAAEIITRMDEKEEQ